MKIEDIVAGILYVLFLILLIALFILLFVGVVNIIIGQVARGMIFCVIGLLGIIAYISFFGDMKGD